jgi:hypothetical protein
MHASLEQLISLRDDEPVPLAVQQHLRACGECAHALDRLTIMRDGVVALEDPALPADAWRRITAAHDTPAVRPQGTSQLAVGLGVAASIVVALLFAGLRMQVPAVVPATMTDGALLAAAGAEKTPDLDQLKAQSRYLEHAVLTLDHSADQMVVSAGSASTVAALQDRIALLDDEINSASAGPAGDGQVAELWRRRVDLLQSLAAVRYAQVANNGI